MQSNIPVWVVRLTVAVFLCLMPGCGGSHPETESPSAVNRLMQSPGDAAVGEAAVGEAAAPAPTDPKTSALLPPSPLTAGLAKSKLLVLGPASLLDPPALKAFADELGDHGWQVETVRLPTQPSEQAVLEAIHTAFDRKLNSATDDRPAGYVLLIGDCASGAPGATAENRLPCNTRNSNFLGAIASDFGYTLPTAERKPRLAVGRWPVRNAEEFAQLCQRSLATRRLPVSAQTAQRNRLHFIAGSPGYSPRLDKLIENYAFTVLTEQVPQEMDLRVLYASTASDFSTGALETDRAEAEDLIEQGPFMTVICSHGTITAISGRARERLLESQHVAALAGLAARTPLFIFTCSSGNFANAPSRSPVHQRLINNPEKPDEQSLAEVALLNPRGPQAVVAATSFSHPLFNKYYCDILIEVALKPAAPGLQADWGTVWYRVQRQFATHRDKELEFILKDVEKIGDLETGAIDHSYMYNFLGDPTLPFLPLKLGQPVQADRRADPGDESGSIRLWGECREIRNGSVEVSVIVTRADIAKQRPKFRDGETPAEHTATAVERYRLTTDKTIASATLQLQDGRFSHVFHLAGTDWLRAKQVRVLVRGSGGQCAAGVVDIATPVKTAPVDGTQP